MKNEETLFLFAKAIKSLIKKQPLDKITVTDIVSTAGKTRQTFYRHFQDKYDLVNWYFEKLVLKSFEEMNQGGSLQEALNLKFAFIEQEHAFFKEAFKSNDYNNLIHYDFCCIYDFYKKNKSPYLCLDMGYVKNFNNLLTYRNFPIYSLNLNIFNFYKPKNLFSLFFI